MLNRGSAAWLAGGIWFATLAAIIALSVAMDARLSTSAFLLLLGMAPPGVVLIIGLGAPSPTVAEILHSVNAEDGR